LYGSVFDDLFFFDFLARTSEPAEPEPAEPGVETEPSEPDWPDQKPTRTEPNRTFPAIVETMPIVQISPMAF